jgi:hypothetical protein
MKTVDRGDPLKFTTEVPTKFEPSTVRVVVADPAIMLVGLSVVIAGTGLLGALMVKVSELEGPPPGVGLVTVTEGVPAAATSVAVIDAVSCVALTKVVALTTPLKLTRAPATKSEPLTVSVKAGEPAVVLLGLSAVMAGTGLSLWVRGES